jgi:hypothetical protein
MGYAKEKITSLEANGLVSIIELGSNLYSKVWKGIINKINTSTI